MSIMKHFAKDESGATAIEYSMVGALIGIGIIAALNLVGDKLNSTFTNVANNLK